MNWSLIATFAAPLITAFIAFFLNKHFQNKPKLIVYYGHISAHKIPSNSGYSIYLMTSTSEPNKAQIDMQFSNKIPMLIKHGNDIWIYGQDANGNTKLTQTKKSEKYNTLSFTENLTLLKEVPEEIYLDITSNAAHASTMYIGTHAVVVRNSGRLPAKNVRLGHQFLPNYNIVPNTKYEVSNLPNGGKEIVFPILVPSEQITISYLYFAPTTYAEINTYVKSDEGLAKKIDVIPAPNLATWQKILLYILLFSGGSALIYLGIMFIIAIFRCLHCL